MMEFPAEDLEIVELPQREALGKGGGNQFKPHHNTVVQDNDFLDLDVILKFLNFK